MDSNHPTEERQCKECSHKWHADRWTKTQTRLATIGGRNEQAKELLVAYAKCPECGSTKVRTSRYSMTNPAERHAVRMQEINTRRDEILANRELRLAEKELRRARKKTE